MSVMPVRHVVTVDKFDRMVDAGVFGDDERVELIEGEIVDMSPIGPPHQACVNCLTAILVPRIGNRAIVQIQGSFRASDISKPEPDVALLRPRDDYYAKQHPDGPDLLLAIEVADTSLRYDRQVKLPTYARGEVPESWVIDLNGRVVEVATEPSTDGYARIVEVMAGATLAPSAFPDLAIEVGEIFGQPA